MTWKWQGYYYWGSPILCVTDCIFIICPLLASGVCPLFITCTLTYRKFFHDWVGSLHTAFTQYSIHIVYDGCTNVSFTARKVSFEFSLSKLFHVSQYTTTTVFCDVMELYDKHSAQLMLRECTLGQIMALSAHQLQELFAWLPQKVLKVQYFMFANIYP